jgi:ribonuclease P protein component
MHAAPKAANAWPPKQFSAQITEHESAEHENASFYLHSKPLPLLLLASGATDDPAHALQMQVHQYGRERRIVKADEFSSAFRLRPVYRTMHFVLHTRTNRLQHARLGVVAAKRLAPRAVTRNTIKRVTRELFRMARLPAIDCIVRLSKPINLRKGPAITVGLKAQLRAELLELFSSQCIGADASPTAGLPQSRQP